MNGWVLFLFIYAIGAVDVPPPNPPTGVTSAVFASQQACESAGKAVAKVRPDNIRWWCVPQSPSQ